MKNPYAFKIKSKFPIKETKFYDYGNFKSPPKKMFNPHYYKNDEFRNGDYINPYDILNIPTNASVMQCRNAYFNLATNPSREIRSKACLAYDILCNEEKYIMLVTFIK